MLFEFSVVAARPSAHVPAVGQLLAEPALASPRARASEDCRAIEASVGGLVKFRKYDNDSDARRRGTFERVSARQLWVGSCEMVAITARGSALHRAVGEARPDGSLREQRAAELRSVLSGAGLGALLPVLSVGLGVRTRSGILRRGFS